MSQRLVENMQIIAEDLGEYTYNFHCQCTKEGKPKHCKKLGVNIEECLDLISQFFAERKQEVLLSIWVNKL